MTAPLMHIVKLLQTWVINTEVKHRLSISLRSFYISFIFIHLFFHFLKFILRSYTLFEFSSVSVASSNVIYMENITNARDDSHMEPHDAIYTQHVDLCSMMSLLKDFSLKTLAKSSLIYLALVLHQNAKDIETNPGPKPLKYPCQICHKAVKWTTPGVCCDSCELWYHKDCMGMSSGIYASIKNISWYCVQCGMPNFSTSLFETHFEDANSFTPLSSGPGSPGSPVTPEMKFTPAATSSPKVESKGSKARRKDAPIKVAVVNFRSIVGKKADLAYFIDSSQPDVIVGTETWLTKAISDSEICPPGYNVIRRDRATGKGGGVLILTSDKFICSEPSELNKHNVVYSLGNAPIYQVFYNKTSSIALLTRFILKLKNLGIVQDINISNK